MTILLCLLAQDIIIDAPEGPNPVAIRESKVAVTIRDQAATVRIRTVFHNRSSVPVEGEYIMSVPAAAGISEFSMKAGDKTMEAELVEADKAREIYNAYVRRQIDPGLLELVGSQMLRARIFPIAPDATMEIEASYQFLVPQVNDVRRLELPMTRHLSQATPIELASALIDIESTDPIKNIYSPSHAVDVARRDDRTARISYEASDLADGRDLLLYYAVSPKDVALSVLAHRVEGEPGTFALLASPKIELAADEILPKDIVFVFDRSGSMRGEKGRQAKAALRFCIERLNAEDRFNIVDFSTDASSYADALVEADERGRNRAYRYIDAMETKGGTNIEGALRRALRMFDAEPRVKMVFFATDGLPTVGERNYDALIAGAKEANASGARLFVFGVGTDVNTFLLDRLAEDGAGARDYVMPEEDIAEKVGALYAKTSAPILTDVKLAYEGFEASEVYPKKLGDLFRGDQLVLFGRFAGTGRGRVTLTGTAKGETRTFFVDVALPPSDVDNAMLPRLWASRKIAFIADQMRLHGTQDQELIDEIVRLSREYGIMTPYTSFLILEDEPVADPAGAVRKELEELKRRAEQSGGAGGEKPAEAASESKGLREGKETDNADDAGRFLDRHQGQLRGGRAKSVKTVDSKTFLLIDKTWTDAAYVKDEGEVVKVVFLSDEYFALLQKAPHLAGFFALGDSVTVVHGGKTYKVVPK